MSTFEAQIQQWVVLDNQLKALNDQIKDIREKKNALTQRITGYAENNNLSKATIQISDGKLKFASTKVSAPLTFKHLEKSLSSMIKNESQIKQIVEHVKQNRETKIIHEIKRFSNN
jgi:hypothetical protein